MPGASSGIPLFSLSKKNTKMQEKLYHLKSGYMVEDIAGKYVLMAPAVGDIDYSKMLVLSESAAFIVNKIISTALSFDTMLKAILNEYEVDMALAKGELKKLLSDLEGLNVFEK